MQSAGVTSANMSRLVVETTAVVEAAAMAEGEEKKQEHIDDPSKRTKPRMIVFSKDGTLGNDKASLARWVAGMTRHLRTELLFLGTKSKTLSQLNTDVAAFHATVGWDENARSVTPSAPLAAGRWEDVCEATSDVFSQMGVVGADIKVSQWHFSLGMLHGADAPLIDDLRSLMMELKSRWGFEIAICTSDDRAPTDAAIKRWDLLDVIDYSICGNEVRQGKPSAEPFLALCSRASVSPSECIVVGDTTSDTGMARRAGAGLCVGVLSGSGDAEQLRRTGADVLLPDVGGLPGLVEKLWPRRGDLWREQTK